MTKYNTLIQLITFFLILKFEKSYETDSMTNIGINSIIDIYKCADNGLSGNKCLAIVSYLNETGVYRYDNYLSKCKNGQYCQSVFYANEDIGFCTPIIHQGNCKFTGKKFNKYIIGSFENKIHTIKFCIYFIILFALYLLRKNNWEEFDEIIKKECPHLPLYRKFNNDGFFIGLDIFLLIGAHYGLYYLFIQSQIHRPFKEEQINKWSMYENLKNLILKILIYPSYNSNDNIFINS